MTFGDPETGSWPGFVNTTRFDTVVEFNSSIPKSLTLYNAGSQNLSYSTSSSAYPGLLSVNPASGALMPGLQTVLALNFNSNGFEPGIYEFDLVVTHNAAMANIIIPCKVKILPNNLFAWEDFSGGMPSGWHVTSTLPESNWSLTNTMRAGGTIPEMTFSTLPYQAQLGTQRLISRSMNTTGFNNLIVEFKHANSRYNADYSLRLETSADGVNWSVAETFPYTNFAAHTETVHVNTDDVGSPTLYVAWTFEGDTFYINQWSIDDIVIAGGADNGEISGQVSLSHQGLVTDVEILIGEEVIHPNQQGHYSLSLYPGTYYLAAHLDGYENHVIRNIEVIAGQILEIDLDLQFVEPVLFPATDLAAITHEYNSVQLNWEAPNVQTQDLHYHNGYSGEGIGANEPVQAKFAIRFTADDLIEYQGWGLSEVSFMLHSMEFNTVAVQIYEGGSYANPGTLVYESDVTNKAIAQLWIDERLAEPIVIQPATEYWIGYYLDATGGYPAACDQGPAITGKGDWIYTNGEWLSISSNMGLNVNWVINALLTSPQDGQARLKVAEAKPSSTPGIISQWPIAQRANLHNLTINSTDNGIVFPASRGLYAYTVYRNDTALEMLGAHVFEYTDNGLAAGIYEYTVKTHYTGGSIFNNNPVSIDIQLPAPIELTATVDNQNVEINWSAPADSRGILAYNVYKDDELIGTSDATAYNVEALPEGTYLFNVAVVYTGDHEGEWSEDLEVEIEPVANEDMVAPVTALMGNYPNPFNPHTTIKFSIKESSHVKIDIYNAKGQYIRTLLDENLNAGTQSVTWDGKDKGGQSVGTGVFLYRMTTPSFSETRKMLLMK